MFVFLIEENFDNSEYISEKVLWLYKDVFGDTDESAETQDPK